MENETALAKNPEKSQFTSLEIRQQVQVIQQVMEDVMKKDVHYGALPGCGDKPTLLKPGAEKIMMVFRLAAEPEVIDLAKDDEENDYLVKTRITHAPTGMFLGTGVGKCSSKEEKYKWRAAVCEEEYEDTPAERRRIKYKKRYNSTQVDKIQQVRVEPADIANTVLKMAKKRSLVDGVLTCTAASDCFNQDLEDLPEGMDTDNDQQRPTKPKVAEPKTTTKPAQEKPPQQTSQQQTQQKLTGGITEPQAKAIERICERNKLEVTQITYDHCKKLILGELTKQEASDIITKLNEGLGNGERKKTT
jgi:hypothetical protein